MRQELEAPQNPDTQSLRNLYTKLDSISRPGATPGDAAQRQQIKDQIKSLEDKLRLTPLSAEAFNLSKRGDSAGVAALLEGSGNVDDVLDGYNWSLLDIARRKDKGLLTTDTDLDAVVTLSRSAQAYVERLQNSVAKHENPTDRKNIQTKAASLLHNIGSFTIPDIGHPTTDSLAIGLEAAKEELRLRTQLGDPTDTLRAELLVGLQLTKSGDLQQATTVLTTAKNTSDKLGDSTLKAFSLAYLSDVADAQKNPSLASQLRSESLLLLGKPVNIPFGQPALGDIHPYVLEKDSKALSEQHEQLQNDADYLRAYLTRK
jgi:hypothetical protein